MEFGNGAGNINPAENFSTSLIPNAELNDTDTWHIHIPHNEAPHKCSFGYEVSLFHTYWEWTMGGQKYFYPVPEHKRTSVMENGDRYVDSGSPLDLDANSPNSPYGNPVMQTLSSEVITMAQWINAGRPIGNYWVIDTDGWAYWADAIAPGTATGLLLNKAERIEANPISDDFYYAIHVNMQHSHNIYGAPDFYIEWGENYNGGWTENGEALMRRIAQDEPENAPSSAENIVSDVPIVGNTIYLRPGSYAWLSLRDAYVSAAGFSPYDIYGINLVQIESNLWQLYIDESLPDFSSFLLTLQQGESIVHRIAGSVRVVIIPEGAVEVVEGRDGTHFVGYGNNSFRPINEDSRGNFYAGCWISGSDIFHNYFAVISTLPIINEIVYLRQGERFSLSVTGTSSEFQRISGNFPQDTEYFSISGMASRRTNSIYAKENAPVGTSFNVYVSQHCSNLTLLGERQTIMVTVIPREADGVTVGESGRVYVEYNGAFRELTDNEMGPPISEEQII